MDCPSRVDEVLDHDSWYQNPSSLSGDSTTRADLNGIVNMRERLDNQNIKPEDCVEVVADGEPDAENLGRVREDMPGSVAGKRPSADAGKKMPDDIYNKQASAPPHSPLHHPNHHRAGAAQRAWQVVSKFGSFIGPGQLSVAQDVVARAIKLTLPPTLRFHDSSGIH